MSLNKHVTYFLWILRLHVYTTCISLNTVKNSLQVYDSNMGMILNKKYMCFKFLMKNLQYSWSWREFDLIYNLEGVWLDLQLGGSTCMNWITNWREYDLILGLCDTASKNLVTAIHSCSIWCTDLEYGISVWIDLKIYLTCINKNGRQ